MLDRLPRDRTPNHVQHRTWRQFFNSLLEFLLGSPMVFAAVWAFNDLLRKYGKRAWSRIRCLIEAWRLGVTDRQDDQSASQAALDFIRSREVDRVADYMRRGRTHTMFSSDDLIAQWISSIKGMADAPFDKGARTINNDLEAELSLRGMEPPYERATQCLARYTAIMSGEIERIRGNQEEWEQLMDDLVKDLQTFKNERDKSN